MEEPQELKFIGDVNAEIALRRYESALDMFLSGLKGLVCSDDSKVSEEQFEYFLERSAAVYLLKNEIGTMEIPEEMTCSFCGKGKNRVETIIGGARAYICSGCVEISNEVISTAKSEDRS